MRTRYSSTPAQVGVRMRHSVAYVEAGGDACKCKQAEWRPGDSHPRTRAFSREDWFLFLDLGDYFSSLRPKRVALKARASGGEGEGRLRSAGRSAPRGRDHNAMD